MKTKSARKMLLNKNFLATLALISSIADAIVHKKSFFKRVLPLDSSGKSKLQFFLIKIMQLELFPFFFNKGRTLVRITVDAAYTGIGYTGPPHITAVFQSPKSIYKFI